MRLLLVILIASCSGDGVPGNVGNIGKDGGADGGADLRASCGPGDPICNSCPEQFPPVGEFPCSQGWNGCHMNTSEWSIDCGCDSTRGKAICCGSASLDACPVDLPQNGAQCCPPPRDCVYDQVGDGGFGATVTCRCVQNLWWECQ